MKNLRNTFLKIVYGFVLVLFSLILVGAGLLFWQTRLLENRHVAASLVNFLIQFGLTQKVMEGGMKLAQLHLAGVAGFGILALLLALGYWLWFGGKSKPGLGRVGLGLCTVAAVGVGSTLLFLNLVLSGYVETAFKLEDTSGKKPTHYKAAYNTILADLQDSKASATLTFHKIMQEVDQGELKIEELSDEDYVDLSVLLCYLVDEQGKVLNKEQHYFRNEFSRAPATLDEMVKTVTEDTNNPFQWKLLTPSNTLFHMMGPDGEYNLKFLSKDGHYEAVYNKQGELLTAQTGPLNMGTFNYASPVTTLRKHAKYDVATYTRWNNVPNQGPVEKNEMQKMRDKFNSNPDALAHYKKYADLLNIQKHKN